MNQLRPKQPSALGPKQPLRPKQIMAMGERHAAEARDALRERHAAALSESWARATATVAALAVLFGSLAGGLAEALAADGGSSCVAAILRPREVRPK